MTRKDFEIIAATIRLSHPLHESGLTDQDAYSELNAMARERVARDFAATLATTNPAFKRDLFLKACGVAA